MNSLFLWKTELYCFVENVHSINSMEISFPFVVNIIPVESSLLKLDEFTLWRSSVLPPPLFCTMHFHKEIIPEKFSVSTTETPIIKRFSGCWQIKLKLHFNHSRKNFRKKVSYSKNNKLFHSTSLLENFYFVKKS